MSLLPRSFTQVEGYREDFDAALKKQHEVRTFSLFRYSDVLFGVRVHPLSLRTWTILDLKGNSLVRGGEVKADDCINALWILRAEWLKVGEATRLAKFLRVFRANRILHRAGYNHHAIKSEVAAYIDDAFLDMPGRFNETPSDPLNSIHRPSVSLEVQLASEVMQKFPSMTFGELRNMPLAQFWQWLNRARKIDDPEYKPDQLTDQVNRRYVGRLNAMRRADREFSKSK